MFYKDKKRAMMKEVIRQAGGENATKESILEVLFLTSGGMTESFMSIGGKILGKKIKPFGAALIGFGSHLSLFC